MRLLFILSFTLAAFLAAVWFVPPRLAIAPDKAVLSAYIDGDIEVGSLALHLLPQPELRLRQVSYRADDMTATLDEVRYGLSWSQLWQVENRWRLTRIEAYDGAIEIASAPNQPIEATLKDIRKTLLALPIPSLRLHNVDIVLEAKKAPTQETLILPSLHADILRRAGDNYRFTFTLGDFTAAGEIKEASAARTAMVLSISAGDDSEELTLAGALQQEPHFQIDAEARFLSRRLLRNVLRNTNITLASDVDDALRLSGVITLTTDYIRAENLQTSLFGEELQTQLNITFDDTNTPTLRIRAASDAIDFSALSSTTSRQAIFSTSPVAPPSFLYTLYATLFGTDKSLAGAFHLVSNQFVLGGERGRNLIVGLDMQDDNFHLTRLSADLPFSSSAVMVGDIATTNFDGRFSLRSSDTASLLSWLAVLFDGDAISLAGHISKIFPQGSGLQRIGVVSDITWAQSEGVRLRDVKGQLGDTAFTSNINLDRLSPLHGQVLVNLQKVDLANWNALVDTRFRGQPKAWFRHLTIEPFLLSVLSGLPPLADIDMHFVVDDMAVGTEHIGASDIHIGFTPDAIEIKRVHFADYLDAETTLSGQLLVQSRHLYGALQLAIEADDAQALSSRLLPPVPFVSVDMGRYIKLNAIWRLPTPDEQDWTSGFIGTAILNKREAQQIALDYTLRSPSRDIDLTTADSTLTLRG
ncbi:MAG: hypothetical protein HAW65_06620, partial [Alphaproteobacteria bacterium]|nr:hypothetical protein [Alphaproteobacteria bacterium]